MLNYQFKDYHLSVFQNYGSPTRVTRLKVVVNMTDTTSLMKNSSMLRGDVHIDLDT